MKSKFLDIQKLKQSFEAKQYDKKSRKQTKPKRNKKVCAGQQNQTQSESYRYGKCEQKKLYNPFINNQKQIKKNQKDYYKVRYAATQSSNSENNEIKQNQEFKQKSFTQTRKLSEGNHASFIGQLNSYLYELKRNKLDLRQNQQKANNQTLSFNRKNLHQNINQMQKTLLKADKIQKKIKRQKSINRNLQKCIIQIQKVLWDRNDKLQLLEEQIKKQSKQKQNYFKKFNQYDRKNLSKTIFFNKDFGSKTQPISTSLHKNIIYREKQKQSPLNKMSKITSRKIPNQQSYDTCSEAELQNQEIFRQKLGRRKTQTPINIEKILSKAFLNKGIQQVKNQKSYNKFQKQELYDV